ncbi:MAG TPA: hypothetical protein VI299_19995 [Polyangiales bacterium]
MRIASSQLSLASSHQLAAREEERASLRVSVGGTTHTMSLEREREGTRLDSVGISSEAREARALAEELRAREPSRQSDEPVPASEAEDCAQLQDAETPQLRLFRMVIEALTGTQIQTAKLATKTEGAEESSGAQPAETRASPEWSVDFDYERTYQEYEHTSVMASGVVKTSDGKEISFAVQVAMERSYSESEATSVHAGSPKLKDPLILNFDGPAGQLSSGTFAFDIDADGKPDNIHFVPRGSAALALDHNDNGVIDDGSELFGTRSGDGFAELAEHDADGNGWIDEGDPVFDQLRLWTRGADGQNHLRSLREGGVGAIALSTARSPFQIKNAQNQLQGVVRSTGVWLSEKGEAKSAQQIDLVV